ncbi:unnamed protein product [Sphagnum troendelagicum]|uniref:Tify domain-containing protein n=1 Tax=Sphagnum troendelagicum TaxID=128251 RepID=A0ABP0UGV9_9BRYO
MTLVMAEKDHQPVYRDFLGLDRGVTKKQQLEYTTTTSDVVAGRSSRSSAGFESEEGDEDVETFATRTTAAASSGTSGRFEASSSVPQGYYVSPPFALAIPSSSSDPGSEFDHRKASSNNKRDYASTRESLQERLQMSVEAIENSRLSPPQKQKSQKYGEVVPSSIVDDLRLSMQPPRLSSAVNPPWLQQPSKPEFANRNGSIKRDAPRLLPSNNNSGLQMPPRISHLGACAEKEERAAAAAAVSRENTQTSPPIMQPAADEGSRTGIKGSPLIGLINNNNSATPVHAGSSGGPPPLPRGPTNCTPSGGSDSLLPSILKGPPRASRHLTIFYGGQAHVFDDVPSDKVEAILAMAGSHGKSWSTIYAPRSAASVPDSASEASLSTLEKEKSVHSRGGSVTGGRSLPLSRDLQTLQQYGFVNVGNGMGCPT